MKKVGKIIEQRPNLEYHNGTSTNQYLVVDPDAIFESSSFKPLDVDLYDISNSNATFNVPQDIFKDSLVLGNKKWIYKNGEEQLPTTLSFKQKLEVASGKNVLVKLFIIHQKIYANYSIKLKEQSTGKLTKATGRWQGVYPVRDSLITTQ